MFKYAGGGWSRDREESQCKAVTEAVERWAFRLYSMDSPAAAALDLDPTTNGFAALPSSFGEERLLGGAYCEAVERWVLSRIWDEGQFPVREICPEESAVKGLFPQGAAVRFYGTELKSAFPGAERIYFVLCLVKTAAGGVLPGSACGVSLNDTLLRSACEARVHFSMNARMNGIELVNLIERRLRHFAEHSSGFALVSSRLRVCSEASIVAAPPAVSIRRLPGDWEPEISICRVMVEQSRHIQEGGLERFLI